MVVQVSVVVILIESGNLLAAGMYLIMTQYPYWFLILKI
jgi:hypothetical protein